MPSTKTLNQSPTISAVENADLLWIWDSSASELNKISRTNLLTTTDDFNTSYARLNGRSGGQTLIGGTAANDDLTLEGTSNDTRTTSYVILQPNGGNVGISTATPGNFNGINFTETILDVNAVINVRGGAPSNAAVLSFGGDTFRKATLLTSAGTDDPYIAINVATSGSNSSSAERLRITSSGNIGLGTASPDTRLDIDAGAIEFAEMTAPAAGAVNTGRLFCRDNGSGKTQLCIIFNTGAIQVIATQP